MSLGAVDFLMPVSISISNTASAQNAVDATNFTFSTQALGAAHTQRKIAVAVVSNSSTGGRTISSVTVGGVSATSIISADGGSTNTRMTAIYLASVPTGTTGDAVVSHSGSMTSCAISLYRLIGASSTVHDTGSDITESGNALSDTINVVSQGVLIACVNWEGSAGARTTTWTGPTEDVDTTIEGNFTYSSASKLYLTTQTGITITATASGTLAEAALAIASFKPS